ncbi:hypothetical protein [Pectinatus cerevisiiphilus]|uniref:DUF2628 domain-containing protein n=1 Tax=Pectinatus cerevisiiphilus TaxID=86956 RepID=A0A4R3KAE9_9FIRM|nr:hypothetical protein [Pectinatus cerevisiiphilus]TCS79621.1 hypothetical protein EDC37_10636 [Pectinatus cerevisiiphilus]
MITLKNIDTGIIKNVPTGYSWTTFLFGFFPALFRGDLKWAIIFFIANIVIGFLTIGIGAFIFNVIFAAFYNKIYIKELMSKRFTYADEASRNYLIQYEIIREDIPTDTTPLSTDIVKTNNQVDKIE